MTGRKIVQMVQMSHPVCVVRGCAVQMSGPAMDQVLASVFLYPGCVITIQTVRMVRMRLSVQELVWQRSSPVQVDCVYSRYGNVTGKTTVGMVVMRRGAGQ